MGKYERVWESLPPVFAAYARLRRTSGQYSAWAAFYGRVWENMGKYESVWECLAAYVFRLRTPSVYFRYLPLLTVLL